MLTEHVLRGGSGAGRSKLELVAERDAAQERLVEVTTAIERRKFALAEKREALDLAQIDLAQAVAALKEFDAQLAARSEALGRSRVALEAASAEGERLAEAVRGADRVRRGGRCRGRDRHRGTRRARVDAAPHPGCRHRATPWCVELETARAAEVQSRIDLETARERVRAQHAQADALQRQLEAERAAAEEAARLAVLRQHQVRGGDERARGAARRARHRRPLGVARRASRSPRAEADRAKQNEELGELRRNESALRERLAALNENVHGLEMQAYEKKLHLSTLLERAAEELGLDEDVLVAEYGPEVPVPVDDRARSRREPVEASADDERRGGRRRADADAPRPASRPTKPYVRKEQEARLATAERKYAQLGRVNPLALEEFAALEQRHKFLTEQLADLTATRKDLLTIIDEIDEKMQDIFASAFEDTKAAFNQVFPVLFPGGTGSLHLTDPDDLLTTGIEVTVRPAGKKIERLSLLSGGERSLAAVALLIAIFKARPSPFYILDEVEAALDDANLGRLLSILAGPALELAADRHHAPEAHDGDRRRALRRLDAPGRRERRRRPARRAGRGELAPCCTGIGDQRHPAPVRRPGARAINLGQPLTPRPHHAQPAEPVPVEVEARVPSRRELRDPPLEQVGGDGTLRLIRDPDPDTRWARRRSCAERSSGRCRPAASARAPRGDRARAPRRRPSRSRTTRGTAARAP